MAVKAKAGLGARLFTPGRPKRSRQGDGQNSKPFKGKHRRKLSRGQGRG